MSQQIRNASKKYMIHYNKLTPIVYMDVKEIGVQLTIRYLCEPKQRRTSSNKIWEDVLKIVEENEDINLANPTIICCISYANDSKEDEMVLINR